MPFQRSGRPQSLPTGPCPLGSARPGRPALNLARVIYGLAGGFEMPPPGGLGPQASTVSALAARSFTEPPAFSIAAIADFDAAATSKVSFALISPLPRSFTPSRGFEHTPAANRASTVTVAPAASLPESHACWLRPGFTSL